MYTIAIICRFTTLLRAYENVFLRALCTYIRSHSTFFFVLLRTFELFFYALFTQTYESLYVLFMFFYVLT